MRILCLDDDPLQLKLAGALLEQQGHTVIACTKGAAAIRAVERDTFDLAILDWMVPDVSGEEVLRWIRGRGHRIPVMFVTSNDAEDEVVHILGLGADDYLVKPLRPKEFLARIEALGRRLGSGAKAAREAVEIGPYRLDTRTRTVSVGGKAVKMTPRMVEVASILFRKAGELVSRTQLYEQAWGRREQLDTRTVDTHVSRLRSALELDGRHGWRLASVYQHGYRLEKTDG